MAVRGTVNPDGTSTTSGDDLARSLNFTNSSLNLPETKDAIYGAFGDILTLDDADDTTDADTDFKYGVYQLATQKPELEEGQLQKIYGTGAMPIFEWVKTIQSGERTYDPNDFEDREKLDAYKNLGELPEGFLTPEQIQQQIISDTATAVASTVGSNIGSAIAQGVENPFTTGLSASVGFGAGLPSNYVPDVFDLGGGYDFMTSSKGKDILFNPALANTESATASGNLDLYKSLADSRVKISGKGENSINAYKSDGTSGNSINGDANIKGIDPNTGDGYKTYTGGTGSTLPDQEGYWSRVKRDATADSTLGSSAGAGIGTFFTDLILTKGEDPMKSAKKGTGAAAGTYIGATLGGPIGAVIGATVGASLGGRVICNELRRQKLMKTKDVTVDLKFTLEYMSPRHIKGYHFWAPRIVLGLRKGKMVKFWYHIAQHRSNEIQYLMGKRKKPDYLGKLYRLIFEPICYIIGIFANKRDVSFLWKEKI